MSISGKIHSFETSSAVDGPGIRFVLFMQGCYNECIYCHNPDTWEIKSPTLKDVDEIVDEYLKYKEFYDLSNGGITVSGGEPLLQSEFLIELFAKLKSYDIHITLDTSASIINNKIKEMIKYVDLFLIDLKAVDEITLKKICKINILNIENFIDYVMGENKRIWIRHVLIPQFTENESHYIKMASYLSEIKGKIERVEFLKFHQLGKIKWEELGKEYPLRNGPFSTGKDFEMIKSIFEQNGITNVFMR